jgi:hypothetical protein
MRATDELNRKAGKIGKAGEKFFPTFPAFPAFLFQAQEPSIAAGPPTSPSHSRSLGFLVRGPLAPPTQCSAP